MNNENKEINTQFLPRHTSYIRNMADRTGKTYRELEAEWKKAEREFEFDRMKDPLKYQNLKKTNGSVAQEISRRFEENVIIPETTEEAETEEVLTDMEEDIFGDEIEENLEDTEDDIESFIEDDFNADEKTEEQDESEDEILNEVDDLVVDESDEFSEEESDEPPIPNKSLEQQKSLERDDSANSPEDVNKKES